MSETSQMHKPSTATESPDIIETIHATSKQQQQGIQAPPSPARRQSSLGKRPAANNNKNDSMAMKEADRIPSIPIRW
jgi:hypothetical protein